MQKVEFTSLNTWNIYFIFQSDYKVVLLPSTSIARYRTTSMR